nr:MAG TPA: Protein of unknown function (DUF1344) [Caudoviricetes sp.]
MAIVCSNTTTVCRWGLHSRNRYGVIISIDRQRNALNISHGVEP